MCKQAFRMATALECVTLTFCSTRNWYICFSTTSNWCQLPGNSWNSKFVPRCKAPSILYNQMGLTKKKIFAETHRLLGLPFAHTNTRSGAGVPKGLARTLAIAWDVWDERAGAKEKTSGSVEDGEGEAKTKARADANEKSGNESVSSSAIGIC